MTLSVRVLVSKACNTIKRAVCQVPPPQKDTKSSREPHKISTKAHKTHIYYHILDENPHLVENMCYNHSTHTISTSIMYDDYDLDYTFTNDYADLDEYDNLDEDYARDAHDLEALAYRHYA